MCLKSTQFNKTGYALYPPCLKAGALRRFSGKRENEKRPFVEGKYGDEIYHETGEWREVNRTVDRDQNRYQEKIVNSRTGEVVKDISEPLDQHCGHGSAKRKHSKQIKSK